ncbi:MAG: hypothetical protein WC319_01805 [Candidatus Paceibacterota bacterium]|jgi:tetrahydromethanopterin S-methyltransferase subunit A
MKKKHFIIAGSFLLTFFIHAFYIVQSNVNIAKKWNYSHDTNYILQYFTKQDFLLGLSYALAVAFTTYSILQFLQYRKKGLKGSIAGIGATGIIYFLGCFLIGCCGSPMLVVYLNLFGASFLGFTKIIVFALTTISILVCLWYMNRKSKKANCNCQSCECEPDLKIDENSDEPNTIISQGIELDKCQKCGCMSDLVNNMLTNERPELLKFRENAKQWKSKLKTVEYSCLGCKYCYPAAATNSLNQQNIFISDSCNLEIKSTQQNWPPVGGDYFALCNGRDCSVAVSTLADINLSKALAELHPDNLCIVGKTETENIGIDKIIKNVVSNQKIKYLILAGVEPEGHFTGNSLLMLKQNGIDENKKIINSKSKRAVLQNSTTEEINQFRKQVEIIDMIGCTDVKEIETKIQQYKSQSKCDCHDCKDNTVIKTVTTTNVIQAIDYEKVELDKQGYFVIMPQQDGNIIVEHYANDNKLVNTVKGTNPREIYLTIINNGMLSQLSHAAYLGKELTKAELSIKYKFQFIQDKA